MKFIIVGLALVACVVADVSELGYNYQAPAPVEHFAVISEAPKNTYIAPLVNAPVPAPLPQVVPQNTYISPSIPAPAPNFQPIEHNEHIAVISETPTNAYITPAVSETPNNHYIAPAANSQAYTQQYDSVSPEFVPVAPQNSFIEPAAPVPHTDYQFLATPAPLVPSVVLNSDGYHYKTFRSVVYRHRV